MEALLVLGLEFCAVWFGAFLAKRYRQWKRQRDHWKRNGWAIMRGEL